MYSKLVTSLLADFGFSEPNATRLFWNGSWGHHSPHSHMLITVPSLLEGQS